MGWRVSLGQSVSSKGGLVLATVNSETVAEPAPRGMASFGGRVTMKFLNSGFGPLRTCARSIKLFTTNPLWFGKEIVYHISGLSKGEKRSGKAHLRTSAAVSASQRLGKATLSVRVESQLCMIVYFSTLPIPRQADWKRYSCVEQKGYRRTM